MKNKILYPNIDDLQLSMTIAFTHNVSVHPCLEQQYNLELFELVRLGRVYYTPREILLNFHKKLSNNRCSNNLIKCQCNK